MFKIKYTFKINILVISVLLTPLSFALSPKDIMPPSFLVKYESCIDWQYEQSLTDNPSGTGWPEDCDYLNYQCEYNRQIAFSLGENLPCLPYPCVIAGCIMQPERVSTTTSDSGTSAPPTTSDNKTPALSSPVTVSTPSTPYSPGSGPLTLLNCSGRSVSIETYNSNDAVMWVPYKKVSLAQGKSSHLKCATSKCKIKIKSKNITTGAITNYQVLKSKLFPTNKAAIIAGCSVY